MILTPTQEVLARNAVQRILLAQVRVLEGAPHLPIDIPYDECQCLLVACATTLGLDIDALDLGPWHAPAKRSA